MISSSSNPTASSSSSGIKAAPDFSSGAAI
jgi:hypothetical protein